MFLLKIIFSSDSLFEEFFTDSKLFFLLFSVKLIFGICIGFKIILILLELFLRHFDGVAEKALCIGGFLKKLE